MILSTHGFLASSGGVFIPDADAQAFFDRVTTAGGSLTLTEKIAVNQLVLDMKDDGIWTKMKAIYPMVGASQEACSQNLKSSSFTGTFTTGWTFASTGVTSNGTSAYFNTQLNCNTTLSQERHFSIYNRFNSSTGSVSIGAILDPNYDYIGLGNFNTWQLGTSASDRCRPTGGSNMAFFLLTSLGSNASMYYNGTAINSKAAANFNKPNANFSIGCAPINSNFQKVDCAFASIGDGLTNTEASNFYTAVQAFQTTLSRQV